MRKLLSSALVFASVVFAQPGKPVASFKDLKFPAPGRIPVPEPVRFQLPNGMILMLVEDHELPTINVNAMIRVGSLWEPAGKAGLAVIAGTVMRTGGSVTRNGDQLDRELDRLAASVEIGIGGDLGTASIFCLKEDIDKALPILADLLQHPAFPQDKIELSKIEQRDNIARRNDDPQGIAGREFNRVLYGKDTPYGRVAENATINAITRDDLVAFHKQFFQPESVIVAAWGDFKVAEMRAKLEQAFASWPRGGRPWHKVPAVESANRGGLYLIDKSDVNQSSVMLGRLASRSDDPDYCALTVMNGILGDGFASRLFSQVRSEQALAYAVWSNWSAEYEFPGVFTAFGGTKSESTVKIIKAIRHEMDRLATDPIGDEELARAKDSILKGMAFEFDAISKTLGRLATYEFHGYPRDFLQRYQDGIRAVTKADVVRVAKQYLKSDQFAVLVLGKEKDFDAPLSSLGKVTRIDITIPK
ncbi:MAG: peptidase domain protein [Candidatus Solibacter sp.]|jgi:zinc protease|nr:peptidase domain protein [Candidatus Solibacter sp.]